MGRRPRRRQYQEGDEVRNIYNGQKYIVVSQEEDLLYVHSPNVKDLRGMAASDVEAY